MGMAAHKQDPVARFWAKVDKTGDCWVWTAGLNRFGYGKFYFEGRTVGAHKASLALHEGTALSDRWVLHHCDNPPCVRPDHLYYGTPAENVHDAIVRGRVVTGDDHWTHREPERLTRGDDHWTRRMPGATAGERNGRAKVTAADAAAIRVTYAAGGISQSTLASQYGVSQVQISHIIRGAAWKALEAPP